MPDRTPPPSRLQSLLRFIRNAWLWPLVTVACLVALWCLCGLLTDLKHDNVQAQALIDASTTSQAYEQYITRSVTQMDQISMQLKQSWEQSGGTLDMAAFTGAGMFLDTAFVSVAIVDRDGKLRSATRHFEGDGALADTEFFRFHQNNISSSLKIGAAPGSLGQSAVLFSRRLDTGSDDFDGVALVLVRASYFTSFFIASGADKNLLGMAGADSDLRVERNGDGDSVFPSSPLYKESGDGAAIVDAGTRRIFSWKRSAFYPVIAVVATDYHAAMTEADRYGEAMRTTALIGSAVLLILGVLITFVARSATLRRQAREEVRMAYRTATESANDGFYMAAAITDTDGRIADFEIVDCNERGAFFYGMTRETMVGIRISRLNSDIFGAKLLDTYRLAMRTGFLEEEREMPDDNRLNIRWGARRLVRVGNGLAITLQDISERKAHLEQLQRLANRDMLTDLPNRHWLLASLPAILARTGELGNELALLFVDLDEFKYVNDAHGHMVGDQVLKAAAVRLTHMLRPGDHVVRLGGDEFLVLINPAEHEAHIAGVAGRIVSAFAEPFVLGADSHQIGASVGISVFPRDGTDAATLIKKCDLAMYAGKNEGKNQFCFYTPSLSHTLQTRIQLKHSLSEALDRHQFVVHYQPRADVASGRICSMEALIRWQHPQRGLVAPGEFIPLAESSGLILRIGQYVLEETCRQMAAWREAGLALVPVSVNVSPKQFAHGDLPLQVEHNLRRFNIAPELLELEITESAMMGEHDEILAQLAAMRALGVKLHIDDFGTGYSSLSQLQKLKMDVLKIDRAFTSELGSTREGTVFFQAIISMAQALGMAVVAEGVETAEQMQLLRELGCDEAQGYLIARPAPAAQAGLLLGATAEAVAA